MDIQKFAEMIAKCPKNKVPVIVMNSYGDKEFFTYRTHASNGIVGYDMDGDREIITSDMYGDILNVMYLKKDFQKKMEKLDDDKKPLNKQRHVGVEIELISKLEAYELKALVADAGIEKFVTVKDDGSIETTDDYPYDHEICIIGTERNIGKLVNKVCNILRGNSRVNKSCGLHVHLDMRDRDAAKAYASLFACQPLLYSMCPPSRVKNGYCIPEKVYESFDESTGDARYRGINKTAYDKHETIEVRIHSGSLNAEKINNWIKLLVKIANRPVADIASAQLLNDYKVIQKKLRLYGKLNKYVSKRIEEFKPDHEKVKNWPEFKIAA